MVITFSQRRRRDIFVETQTKNSVRVFRVVRGQNIRINP